MHAHRLAWILLILFQLQLSPVRELIKVPMLWIHFQEDGDEGSFLDFLYGHYQQEQIPDEDWQKDLNLPFKDGNQYHFLDLAILNESVLLTLSKHVITAKSLWGMQHKLKGISSLEIFHPPNE